MNFELVNFCEIDKYAEKSYCAIYGVDANKNLGDICKVDIKSLPLDIDLITHGSPCVSFSRAGLQLGGDRGSGTPSSLMWNSVEIIRYCKPKFVIWENVSTVLSPKHIHNFLEYIDELKEIGYNSYYKKMNSKDYGWPQFRDRIFVVSVRKDTVEKYGNSFVFPEEKPLEIKFEDLCDKEVDKEWYLTETQIVRLETSSYEQNQRLLQKSRDYCYALCARDYKDPKCINLDDGKGPRRLTPKEYWRIMGFDDEDFNLAQSSGNSNSQLYKQAGNALVVPVMKLVFEEMKKQYNSDFVENMRYLSLFSGIGAFEKALTLV